MKLVAKGKSNIRAGVLAVTLGIAATLSTAAYAVAQTIPLPLQPVQTAASQLVGTWERVRSDATTYQKITLVLRADGTYTKSLVARVNGSPFGGTHDGTWTAKDSTVYLSGDGNWPAISHDLAEFRRTS